MIQKLKYGNPFETEAVVMELPCQSGAPAYGTVSVDEHGFRYACTLPPHAPVYGLGENVRGINKRGWHYASQNIDDNLHYEDRISLYSAHNFLILSGDHPVGLFFDYPSELFFDVGYAKEDELAVTCQRADLYLYVITGDSLKAVAKTFREMIGQSYIAPKWAMGYGQSRWGYKTPEDFRRVADTYRALRIPLDSIYMDIDYMERYKDFTVNQDAFPDFPGFVAEMKAKNIRLVPIIDAGIKQEAGYDVCDEGVEQGYFCTDALGKPYETACWPGVTYHPDFLNTDARRWFGAKYRRLTEQGIEGFWNDMNEPSIFYTKDSMEQFRTGMADFLSKPCDESNYFEMLSLQRQLSGAGNYQRFYHLIDGKRVRHDQVHNLYGYYMTRAAGEAFDEIAPDKRLLLFSRSSYIGMHRYGGIWQGDNSSWWSHLLLNIQMCASLNLCGFLYTGADIGGFGGDVTRDLLLRWLAFGVFTPLMRNHSASNTREQECYQFEHPEDFAHVIGVRYRLLPYLYSEYVKAALNNDLYFRPLAFDYSEDSMAVQTEDQLLLGDGLMVTPVYTQNAEGRTVYLPEDMLALKFLPDGSIAQEKMTKGLHYISVALNEVPVFVKKNHILPVAEPAECVAELDEDHLEAIGWVTEQVSYVLYQDDGVSKDYHNPNHYRRITMQ